MLGLFLSFRFAEMCPEKTGLLCCFSLLSLRTMPGYWLQGVFNILNDVKSFLSSEQNTGITETYFDKSNAKKNKIKISEKTVT